MSEGGESSSTVKTRASKVRKPSANEGEVDDYGCGRPIYDLAEVYTGMKIEATDKYGKMYVAKVLKMDEKDCEVLVHFENWSSRYDEFIPLKSGRLYILSKAKLEELEKEKEKLTHKVSLVPT